MIKSNYGRVIFYIFLLIAHIGLVWWLPYLPTQDGPSHIYNLVILHDLLNGGKEWGDFFSYQLSAVPNLGFILLAYPLLHFFPPLVVEKIFLSLYIVLMGVSVPFFLRTFEKPAFPISYFVFPVIFNYTLFMGFYSYIVAVPLFLLAFSLAWRIRNSSTVCKFLCLNILGIVIFYVHLIPFIFFLLSLIVITVAESADCKKNIKNLLKLLLITSPSILNLLYYLKFSTSSSMPDFSYLLSLSRYVRLFIELLYFSTANFLPWQILPASLFMLLIVMIGYHSIRYILRRQLQTRNITASEKTLLYFSLILIFIYLLAPFSFGGGLYFNERFPWVILLISLPILRIPETILSKRIIWIVIAGVVSIFFIFNAVILWRQSSKVEKFLSGLHVKLPKGALVMTYKPNAPQMTTVDILLHTSSYYGILKGYVDIGNYEADTDLFPIRFNKTESTARQKYQTVYKAKNINWENYPEIQYLLAWEIDNREREVLNKHFHIIWEQDEFNIWQRNAL
jgi:hypothetical protein